jgi:hypothetical protein
MSGKFDIGAQFHASHFAIKGNDSGAQEPFSDGDAGQRSCRI